MKKSLISLIALLAVPFLIAANPVAEKAAEKTPTFLRLAKAKDGSVEGLQTAIVTYQKGDVKVDLVSVIHIGDKSYYKQLGRHFEQYDALLYELVAPKGKIPARGEPGLMAKIIKNTLELDSQTDRIDYSKKNFVHADLSFEEMKEKMAERGEDPIIVGLKVISEALQQKNLAKKKVQKNPLDAIDTAAIAMELSKATTPVETKRALAKLLLKQGTEITPTVNVLLIDDRNGKAMQVVEEQIKAGKKNMGLFYGAAHMPDFDKRMKALGFTQKGTTWMTAWDLTDE